MKAARSSIVASKASSGGKKISMPQQQLVPLQAAKYQSSEEE